jgi:hypothetical protein
MTLSQADIDSLLGPEPADSVESLLDAPLTGEDISLAMQDPAFTPTQADYLKYEEYAKTKQTDWINTIAQSVDAAANMIGGAISEGAQGAVINPLNYIEGAAQGTRQLYGLIAQSQDPSSPLFKFKDLVAGSGTAQSRYEQFLEARDFANRSARLESGQDFLAIQPEFTNPEFVQGVSMILDPTLALPGIGEIIGAGKLATRAVGKGAQLTGRAVAGVARPLERVAGAAERMTAEAIGMTPEALRTAASTAGVAGALGIAPELATAAAIPAGIRTAREVGEAITAAGENLMTQPSRIGPLEAIGAAPGANLRQRMLGVIGQYGGDAAVDAALRGTAGGLEGAVLGTGLGYLSGGEEGAAAGLGSGAAQGAAGAIGGRAYQKLTGAAAKEARAGDLGRFIDAQQDPTTKALFERVRDQHGVDTASALMDVEGLVKGRFGDVDVKYLSDTDFVDQYKGRARGVQVEIGDRPTIVINADILGKGKGDSPLYTLGHELFHALEKSEQLAGGATEIKSALVGRWIQEGDTIRKLAEGAFNDAEIEARFNEYRDKLAAGSPQRAAELAQFDTINKKADYIASELAAEHFAALIAGQKPDAMLKGFSGLTRQLLDAALTQNASKAIANAAASIERTFGVKPTDSVLFPDLKQASPQVNAMLRDLVRARRKLDEKIMLDDSRGGRVLKPEDVSNPLAAKELVDLGLAEQMPDGSIRNLSSEEIRARDDKDLTSLRSITEKIPGARLVDGEITGRFSPEQLSAIEQSQTISSRMKDKIRAVNLAMENGNSLFVTYFAALRRVRNRLTGKDSPKYSSGIKVSEREFSPYSFWITKADNPVVRAIDITKVRNELSKLLKKDGSIGGLWNNTDGFMTDLARYFTNLDQKEGARRSAEIFGVEKAKFLGDFVGAGEKTGSKFVRSFRLDRVGSMSPMDFKAKFSEEAYQLSKNRWMPAETIGDKSIINSDEGYRIISGAKHKLYGPDGKLIGIYDTQTQAERKADATQARLQPEVDQQQRVPGDEVRQTAEAGGRNRIERGQEGQGEGGAVRQAGDVRFMPSDSDYLEAVNSGDTATAQRMVDEAAKAAGYTIGPVYHGTPTGGFNVFDKRMRGETSGVSRQAFSFTTDKKAAEGYSKRLGDEAVRLDAGLRVANDAMRMFDEDVAAQEYFSSKGYSSVDDGMLPEFDWGSIDDVPGFIKELRGHAKDLKPINKRLSDSFIEAAKVMTSTKAVPEVKRVFLRIPEGAPVFQATPQTLGQVMSGFSAENQPTKAGIVELPGNERIYYVADSSQVKLVDAITKDDAGNVIPLSQRFKATSEDIRFMPASDQDTKALQMLPKPRRSLDAAYRDGVKTRSQDPQYYDVPDYVGYDMARTAAFEMGREGAEPPRWVMAERIGKLPTEGRSKNFAEDRMERGVSVLRIVGEPQSDVGTYEMFNPGEKRYVAGWLVGLGSDGEPLLADAVDLGPASSDVRMMPSPDSAMPGAYSFPGGYRAIPGKAKGSLRLYGPAGSLIGIAASLDEAQRIIRKKSKQ